MLHTLKRSDYEGRLRNLSSVQRNLRNNLVGTNQYWYNVRHVMIQRANLQHLARTLEAIEAIPFTTVHRAITQASFRLSTSRYSQVRRGGQQLLRNIFDQFPGSYREIIPNTKNLRIFIKQTVL